MTAIERLEKWNAGHKARSVVIDIDNGYGATCWRVELTGEKLPGDPERGPAGHPTALDDRAGWLAKHYTVVRAAECSFLGFPDGTPVEEQKRLLPPTVVFACPPWEDFDDWPGLEKVIHAAIDRWEQLTGPPAG